MLNLLKNKLDVLNVIINKSIDNYNNVRRLVLKGINRLHQQEDKHFVQLRYIFNCIQSKSDKHLIKNIALELSK